jgi:predicted nucleic acid-binding protein
MAKKILVDTNVFAGFFNEDDALHERATRVLLSGDRFITTEHVFDELVNVLTRRKNYADAKNAGQAIIDRDLTLLQLTQKEFDEAWELFSHYPKLSFTDCVNIIMAKATHCDAIATFDAAYKDVPGVVVIDQ